MGVLLEIGRVDRGVDDVGEGKTIAQGLDAGGAGILGLV